MTNDVQLILGDCREAMAELEPGSVSAIVTDPPYGIDYRAANGASFSVKNPSMSVVAWSSIEGDSDVDGSWLAAAFRSLADGGAIYLCTRWDVEPIWRALLAEHRFSIVQRLTWHKRVHGKGDLTGTYAPTCEDVLFASKGRHKLNHRPPMLLDVGCVPTWEHRYHPHQKPVALPRLLIETSTKPGDLVLDPFMGSGTTGLACQQLGRRFIGIELDPTHYETARRRILGAPGETTRQRSLFASESP